jgi:hypothetical protein
MTIRGTLPLILYNSALRAGSVAPLHPARVRPGAVRMLRILTSSAMNFTRGQNTMKN